MKHLTVVALLVAAAMPAFVIGTAGAAPAASPSSAGFHGVNWAANVDNFMATPVVPVGLTPDNATCANADYNSVHGRADAILANLHATLPDVNTIRFPINPASVLDTSCAGSTWWAAYKGAIDDATGRGMNVILSFWEANLSTATHGTIADTTCAATPSDGTTCFNDMWNTVVNDYATNAHVYFEPMNEPHGYSATQWEQVAEHWVSTRSQVPRGRIVISGAGFNSDVQSVGGDANLAGTLLSQHYYKGWCNGQRLATCLGSQAGRAIVDEYGDTMDNGTNYDDTGANADISYVENTTEDLRTTHAGSLYWPGIGGKAGGAVNGDHFRLLNLNADNTVTPTNQSGVDRVRYGWDVDADQTTPCAQPALANGRYEFTNVSSGDVIDVPQGNTANGVDLDQWPRNDGTNQQWSLTAIGCDLYSLTSMATGKSIDISGQSTANGAKVDQWDYWHGGNQQFVIEPAASGSSQYVIASVHSLDPIEDPAFAKTAGTPLDQWVWNHGTNQQWTLTRTG